MKRLTPTRKPTPRRGRVVALFGPPGAGVTTIVRVLVDASKLLLAPCAWAGGETGQLLGSLEPEGPMPDVWLLDSLRSADELKVLHQVGHINGIPGGGCVVQVHANVALTDDDRAVFNQRRAAIEQVVRLYTLPYFTINNVRGDLEAPVGELARRAHVRK